MIQNENKIEENKTISDKLIPYASEGIMDKNSKKYT